MSALTITVTRQNNEAVTEPLHAEFGVGGGTIGRSAGSTLLLPDPDRQISRTHAIVEMQGTEFVLRDQGSATPVIVNGQALGNGRSTRIKAGDEIVIAHYTMRVESPLADDATVMIPAATRVPPASAPSEADISMIGTVLSWSEEGMPGPADGIQTVIVPSPVAAQSSAPSLSGVADPLPASDASAIAPATDRAAEVAPAPAAAIATSADL